MSMKYLFPAVLIGLVLALLVPDRAEAACSPQYEGRFRSSIIFTGDCTEDNEVLITTSNLTGYSSCTIMSTTGAVDVVASLDGTNYSTAPLSLIDMGATDTAPVIVTVALRVYAFPLSGIRYIRVLENGTTDAAASLTCVE